MTEKPDLGYYKFVPDNPAPDSAENKQALLTDLESQLDNIRERLDVLEEVIAHDEEVRQAFRDELQKTYTGLLLRQAD